MDIMFYVSGILKTLGIIVFVIGYPLLGIISFILLHLQNNRKAARWGSNLLFLILPYIIFVILLMMSIEMSLPACMRFVLSGLLLGLTPLPHLLIVRMGKKENSRKLIRAGWLAFASAACAGGGVFFTFIGICV
ncbi:MAG: hypothetical protein IJS01_10265 [Lentisphaeria bacterium]|nr:hypothetical protein [Lentisphaeria bacterium]